MEKKLTDTMSSGAPFTIWNSLRMKPDGLLPSAPFGGLGEADRLAVARRLMVLLCFEASVVPKFVWNVI